MTDHQIHFDRKFYQDKEKGYWISCTCPKIRAHRWVWVKTHGIIPKGYHIHHKDKNKSNNTIENLELIERSRHLGIHSSSLLNRDRMKKMADKYRPLTKPWHASLEGKEWHRQHAIKCNFGNGQPREYNCKQCGKPYQSKLVAKNRSKFCSNACKSAWRRDSGLDDIVKKCATCDKEFIDNKYDKKINCTRKCTEIMKRGKS